MVIEHIIGVLFPFGGIDCIIRLFILVMLVRNSGVYDGKVVAFVTCSNGVMDILSCLFVPLDDHSHSVFVKTAAKHVSGQSGM